MSAECHKCSKWYEDSTDFPIVLSMSAGDEVRLYFCGHDCFDAWMRKRVADDIETEEIMKRIQEEEPK